MSLDSVVQELSGTHAEVLVQVKARTTTQVGRLAGAELGGVLLGFGVGLISFITDKASATGTSTLIRDICIGMTDRFKPDGEIDFSNPSNVALIDAFLADSEVAALLASPTLLDPPQSAIPASYVKDAILAKASTPQPEFPDVTLADIIAIRDPGSYQPAYTDERYLAYAAMHFELLVLEDLAYPVDLRTEVKYDSGNWEPIKNSGMLNAVQYAGPYIFKVIIDPADLVNHNVYIRVVSDFAISMSL